MYIARNKVELDRVVLHKKITLRPCSKIFEKGEIMKEFSILHLSDLHINDGNKLQEIYTNLIVDFKKQQKKYNLKNIIIVITGDIVNRGSINAFENNAIKFIETLKTELGLGSVKYNPILIVPGNHDIQRDSYVKTILDAFDNKNKDQHLEIEESFYSKRWNFVKTPFENFTKFYNLINFNSNDKNDECVYGINTFIFDGCHICFIRINTSWACRGDNDKNNLRIGKWQLDQLIDQIIKKKIQLEINEFDLTIVMMHHPISWLNEDEQKVIYAYLSGVDKFNANIVLHGHIHKGEVAHTYNIDSSLLTLVTGVGWDAADKSFYEEKKCRYSFYKFDLSNNYADVWMRITNDKSTFIKDINTYNNLKDGHFKCTTKMQMFSLDDYIGLPSIYPEKIYPIRIRSKLLETIKENSARLSEFRSKLILEAQTQAKQFSKKGQKVTVNFNKNIKNFSLDVIQFIESNNTLDILKSQEILTSLDQRITEYETIIYQFLTFLKKICVHIHNVIFKPKEFVGIQSEIRTHFRIADKETKTYKKLVAHREGSVPYNEDMSDISWEKESMIHYVIERGCSLVKSANPENAHQKSKNDDIWIDYITVPFKEFAFYCGDTKKQLPWLTMGISVADKRFVESLYALNYLEIENYMEECLRSFSTAYGIAIYEIFNCYTEMKKIM